jgi:hypothetical protein
VEREIVPVFRCSFSELLAGLFRAIGRLQRRRRTRFSGAFADWSSPGERAFNGLLMAVGRFFPALFVGDWEAFS